MSLSDVNTFCEAASTAIGLGDYTTARVKLEQSGALLGAIPDSEKGRSSRIQFFRDWIAKMIELVTKQENKTAQVAAGGMFRTTKVTYVAPTA